MPSKGSFNRRFRRLRRFSNPDLKTQVIERLKTQNRIFNRRSRRSRRTGRSEGRKFLTADFADDADFWFRIWRSFGMATEDADNIEADFLF
jgi:hypothetical protein